MAVEIDKNVSAHLPGTWGLPRSVRLERIPGQSLGISIVGKIKLRYYRRLVYLHKPRPYYDYANLPPFAVMLVFSILSLLYTILKHTKHT